MEVAVGDRKFMLPRRARTLADIDRPKNRTMAALVAHPSEAGWNLPSIHDHYYLNFL